MAGEWYTQGGQAATRPVTAHTLSNSQTISKRENQNEGYSILTDKTG